jgi:hypothetical protein
MNGGNGEEAARRRIRLILRKASLYAWGFFALALATALGGAALVAWVLARAGLPFLESWLVVSGIVLLPSLLGIVWRALRDPSGHGSLPEGPPDEPQEPS